MGVDTKAIITKGTTLEKIVEALKKKYANVTVSSGYDSKFFWIVFTDAPDDRSMAVSFNGTCKQDNGIDGVWISLGCFGNSVEIMKYLCETFGGYLDESDCDDQGFYPINIELYNQGKEFTKRDELVNRIIAEFGYDKIKQVLRLFDEYKEQI